MRIPVSKSQMEETEEDTPLELWLTHAHNIHAHTELHAHTHAHIVCPVSMPLAIQ